MRARLLGYPTTTDHPAQVQIGPSLRFHPCARPLQGPAGSSGGRAAVELSRSFCFLSLAQAGPGGSTQWAGRSLYNSTPQGLYGVEEQVVDLECLPP